MRKITFILLFFTCLQSHSQEFIPLWDEGKKLNWNGLKVSDSLYNERIWRVGTPGIYAFLVPPSENKGISILICPGRGFERLSHIYNGFNFARYFNAKGINVFVLIYRLPHQKDMIIPQDGPLADAQRAMRLIRSKSRQWNLDSTRTGVMGISAGGHVAARLGTYTADISSTRDALSRNSFRPDFMILLSPVITMGKWTHRGSRRNMLGADTSAVMVDKYSVEKNVSPGTPPAFLVHAENDSSVHVRNSVMFYQALLDKQVSASLHIFPQGGHGIKLVDNPGSTELWLPLLDAWLREKKFLLTK